MARYVLRLTGPATADRRLPATVAADVLGTLQKVAEGAVRIRIEGRSSAEGKIPEWLEKSAAFDIVDLQFPGSEAMVVLGARTLREALPERFGQGELFTDLDPDNTAIGIAADALHDALGGQADSAAYDDPLLHHIERLRRVFRRGVDEIELRNARPDRPAIRIDPDGIRAVHELHRRIPAPQRVRIAGRIDEIRYSDRGFKLLLTTGRSIRGVLVRGDAEQLRPHFGRVAVVSGMAHFRPSGSVHRIEADHIASGTESELALWSEFPEPLDLPLEPHVLRRPQGPRSGINAVIGSWPGDEDDEEIFRILDQIS